MLATLRSLLLSYMRNSSLRSSPFSDGIHRPSSLLLPMPPLLARFRTPLTIQDHHHKLLTNTHRRNLHPSQTLSRQVANGVKLLVTHYPDAQPSKNSTLPFVSLHANIATLLLPRLHKSTMLPTPLLPHLPGFLTPVQHTMSPLTCLTLPVHYPYDGTEEIVVGDGTRLSISHIGTSSLSSSVNTFSLSSACSSSPSYESKYYFYQQVL